MKQTFTLLFLAFSYLTAWSCSCDGVYNFCEHSKIIKNNDKGIIWIGNLMHKEEIDSYTTAFQFKLEELISGKVITPTSVFANNSSYENTDSTIWVLGGEGSLCYRNFSDQRAIFAISYDTSGFGYTAGICSQDYMPIESNNELSGYIWSNYNLETISLQDLRNTIDSPCISNNDDFITKINESFEYTNPSLDFIDIISQNESIEGLQIEIYSIIGQKLLSHTFEGRSERIDISNFAKGIYILSFVKDRYRHSKKVIKT